jgi:hypothetical protein
MDLPATVRMSILRKLRELHIEPTDVCQAACALCAREIDPLFDKNKSHHLTLLQIQKHFDDTVIGNLEKMSMCGNYGDPAAGYYTIDIFNYFRKVNPTITLGMNTNGALRSPDWWYNLGQLLNTQKDFCVFSIDGLEDTNHIYRKNVNWQKLINNVESFISGGGNAHWDMLVYRHNQHQVDACEKMARDMGFKWFRAKVSKRGLVGGLEFPIGWEVPQMSVGNIQCRALKEDSMYIDVHGRLTPCTWLNSLQKVLVKDDLESVRLTWNTNTPHPVCLKACSSNKNKTNFTDQWRKEIEL